MDELRVKVIECYSDEELPSIDSLKTMEYGTQLKVLFGDDLKKKREKTGKLWKRILDGFQVGLPLHEDAINVIKLLPLDTITKHQDFLEKCARDYRDLSIKLITELSHKLNLRINPENPLDTLNGYRGTPYKSNGKMGKWYYHFHGFHCGFEHTESKQRIETPLTYGLEFGVLDPYFFSLFLKSTPDYRPLPFKIFSDYNDGQRILDTMVKLDKFEVVGRNFVGEEGIAVKDRELVYVKILED